MEENKEKWIVTYRASFISVIVMVLLLAVAVICHLYLWHDAPFQFLAACLGAGVTVIITNLLLVEQTKQRRKLQTADKEIKENLKLYESKISVYSEFISKMWGTLEDDRISDGEAREIRSEFFNKLVFYLKPEQLSILSEMVVNIRPTEGDDNGDSKEAQKRVQDIRKCFSSITEMLRHDLEGSFTDSSNETSRNSQIQEAIEKLWTNFGIQPIEKGETRLQADANSAQSNTIVVQGKEQPKTINEQPTSNMVDYVQAWHFAMLGDEQLSAIGDGRINELSLCEYGEYWRTNMLMQVGKDDIVFLFRRGGYGYIGAFRPLGWRVFEYNQDEQLTEKVLRFGEEQTDDIVDINSDDVKKYDIYGSLADSADICANLLVEPIYFIGDGVGYNPGGVYRRTISRYDSGYATELMNWFAENAK